MDKFERLVTTNIREAQRTSMLPSKKLLSEVLGVNNIVGFEITGNMLNYSLLECKAIDDCEENLHSLNIYELMHKMKEWALYKGYELRTSTRGIVDFYYVPDKHEFIDSSHLYDNEVDSTTKACEWILKELQNEI